VKLIVFIMLVGAVQLAVELALEGFTSFPDTEGYVDTVYWFKDGSGETSYVRIQRPLQILMLVGLEPLVGVTNAFIVTNSAFYLLSLPFFFILSLKLLRDESLAALSTVLYMCSFCVLYWGLAQATDMLHWMLVCMCFGLLLDLRADWDTKRAYLLAALIGLASINKESIVALVFILMYIFAAKFIVGKKDKLANLLRFLPILVVIALPFVLVQALMWYSFGYEATFFGQHLTHKTDDVRGALWYLPLTFLIAFNILLVAYIVSARRFFAKKWSGTKIEYAIWVALMLIPVVIFEQYSPRLSFFVFPLVIPIAALGLSMASDKFGRFKWPAIYAFLAVYCIGNNIIALFGDEVRELLGIWAR